MTVRVPEHERLSLGNGVALILVPRRDVPLVTFTAVLRGGGLGDPASRPGVASLRTQLTCSRRETELAGSTSSSAARPSLLRNVRRVSRERSVREDRLLSASVVTEITR